MLAPKNSPTSIFELQKDVAVFVLYYSNLSVEVMAEHIIMSAFWKGKNVSNGFLFKLLSKGLVKLTLKLIQMNKVVKKKGLDLVKLKTSMKVRTKNIVP